VALAAVKALLTYPTAGGGELAGFARAQAPYYASAAPFTGAPDQRQTPAMKAPVAMDFTVRLMRPASTLAPWRIIDLAVNRPNPAAVYSFAYNEIAPPNPG